MAVVEQRLTQKRLDVIAKESLSGFATKPELTREEASCEPLIPIAKCAHELYPSRGHDSVDLGVTAT